MNRKLRALLFVTVFVGTIFYSFNKTKANVLFEAINAGNEARAVEIVKAHPGYIGKTYAVRHGKGDDAYWVDGGETGLHAAARAGMDQLVAAMVAAKKVDINVKDKQGRTPMYLAAVLGVKGNPDKVVAALIAAGADIDQGKPGLTLVNEVLQRKRTAVARQLVDAGAKTTPADLEELAKLEKAAEAD
ncbi:MAG: ankyrin repeat domain-containing protein [Candidatus Eremiobacteraeota bacterium]|nr:ankyrin repeat domain-containing protein [Candidatus Eremiobacteraeota bacterium]